MYDIIHLDSIKTYNEQYGLPVLHPLVTVVDVSNVKSPFTHAKINYGLYALFLKHGIGCTIHYGRQAYDYQEGSVVSFAPGQTVLVDVAPDAKSSFQGLLFHPDLIYGTSLGDKIRQYTFFSYSQAEALHLSESEQDIIKSCMDGIQSELEHPVDHHSRNLLCTRIELLLDYCMRFYDRQFCTRAKVNSNVLQKFELELSDYLDGGRTQQFGLPSVKYFADKVCLSPSYFGDLVKKETGKTAQEYIQLKIIDRSKQILLGSEMTVSQVADTLGFQYPQHFIRMFKKQTGYTPKEFRVMN